MSSNKPFPSSDLDVFKENSTILDHFVNSQENEHPDRFNRKRPTITGIIKEAFNVRTDISNMNETLIGQSRWDVVPKNTSLSLGGDNGALNKQAQALFNRTVMLKVHAREALRRSYLESGLVLVPGSFEDGGKLETIADVMLEEKTGKVYSWVGSFPKVVNKDSLPTNEVEWKESTETLRSALLTGPLSKNDERLSLRDFKSVVDFQLSCDGVTDDTLKWNAMVEKLDTTLTPAFIPFGKNVLLRAGTKLPKAGVCGAGRMTSIITIKHDPAHTSETVGLIYGSVGAWANSYGSIQGVKIQVENENESPIVLLKINTVSRGAGMRDVTLHCGTGCCVGVEDFYYYQFDNVVFEGKYIPDNEVGPSNTLKGCAFKQLGNKEINNIQFNKCDFRYLEKAFQAAGTFIGSNAIGLYNCSIEKMGKGLGTLNGWLVTFNEGYWEKLGLNRNYAANEFSLFSCGAGNVTATNVLINLGSLPATNPLIEAVLCEIQFNSCAGSLPTNFSSSVLRQINYSTKGVLKNNNTPFLDNGLQRGYNALPQQHVGGYSSSAPNSSFVNAVETIGFSRNKLSFLVGKFTNQYALPEKNVCNIMLPTNSVFMFTLEGTVSHFREDTLVNELLKISGSGIIDTTSNTNQTLTFINNKGLGVEFDTSWDAPYFIRYGNVENNSYRKYELVFSEKTQRGYPRTILITCTVNLFFISGTNKSIGIVAL